jgi:hypothetical protein
MEFQIRNTIFEAGEVGGSAWRDSANSAIGDLKRRLGEE